MDESVRVESDLLGTHQVPADALYGIHTLRALEHFHLAGRPVHPELIKAFGWVKLACARTNRSLGDWRDDPAKAEAVEQACREMADVLLTEHVRVDLLQGGAGTSTNMNVNEARCRQHIEDATATLTALVSAIGYEHTCRIARRSAESGRSVREIIIAEGLLSSKDFDDLISTEAICRLGMPVAPPAGDDPSI